ncbi:MAG: hypothetical protein II988_00285 [Clostridia bacterium]|nr:hypothetical protein [Clostridia bacterium]
MKKFLTILLCVFMAFAVAACGGNDETPAAEKTYKLGMGIVVNMDSSATGNAQVDATVATVVTDADGKIVACRLDCAQNKMEITNGAFDKTISFQTKMELGSAYGMGQTEINDGNRWMDNDEDGRVLEWDAQAKAFEAYAVGKTAAQIDAMETKEANGHWISTDEALLSAGCTIQIGDFCDAVVKACNDEQGFTFKTSKAFTLGVAAKTTAEESTETEVKMYTDFAASAVIDGKIVASLNDAIQPVITINANNEIKEKAFVATKRELKEGYNMAAYGQEMDWNNDGKVLEWYIQSAAFSNFVVGKTATQVADMATKTVESSGYVISADDDLLAAGCTIQITGIKAVVAQSVTNAR